MHCGIEWLGPLNDVAWRTDVPGDGLDSIPPEWQTVVDASETIEVSLLLRTDPEPMIMASVNDYTVTYRPTAEERPGCD